jgi:nascent polypeptide-associated complex subunit alpha
MKIDNRQARRLMERMGIEMKEVKDVEKVVIFTRDKELVIINPSVSEINAQGARIFQVTGQVNEQKKETQKFTEEDIMLVQQQANVSRERAIAALEESNGEVARAILKLTTQG